MQKGIDKPTKDLSVIVPFVNEYPQVAFTVNNIYCELRNSGIDFEVIIVDNWTPEVREQVIGRKEIICPECGNVREEAVKRVQDKGSEYMRGISEKKDWLKYFHYTDKLSHWQAKNLGITNAEGKILLFIDSHCILSKGVMPDMYRYYVENYEELNGTLHMPLAYMLEREGLELVYKLVLKEDHGVVHYSFTRYRIRDRVYKAPCMSTCGMMMDRELFFLLGGWPTELGIYGGGENFINFTLAILGKDINIFNSNPLFHYAEKRGYNWNHTDYHRNRAVATYMYGGRKWCRRYIDNLKGRPGVWDKIYEGIDFKCVRHRGWIKSVQAMEIEEWIEKWRHWENSP